MAARRPGKSRPSRWPPALKSKRQKRWGCLASRGLNSATGDRQLRRRPPQPPMLSRGNAGPRKGAVAAFAATAASPLKVGARCKNEEAAERVFIALATRLTSGGVRLLDLRCELRTTRWRRGELSTRDRPARRHRAPPQRTRRAERRLWNTKRLPPRPLHRLWPGCGALVAGWGR